MLACLAGGIVFWLFNALQQTYVTRIDYPIVFQGLVPAPELEEKLPQKITLEVAGEGWLLLRYLTQFDPDPLQIAVAPGNTWVSKERLYVSAIEELQDLNVKKVITKGIRLPAEAMPPPPQEEKDDVEVAPSATVVATESPVEE